MEIEKAYFTLPEILDRWSISEDLLYLAENDKLRLSVRIFNLPVEFGENDKLRLSVRVFNLPSGRPAPPMPASGAKRR